MSSPETKPKRKFNPKSLENLIHEGRAPIYGETKRRRYLTVTDRGWERATKYIQSVGFSSMSDYLENIGMEFESMEET